MILGSYLAVVTAVVTIGYWSVCKAPVVIVVTRALVGSRGRGDQGRYVCLIDGVAKTCDRRIYGASGTSSDAHAATSLDDGVEYLPVFLEAICLGNSRGLVLVAPRASLLNDVERMNIFIGG